ncbi:MAG TPA: DUF4247 domain-containing protein [Solirubrobacteraceae bacterium]
MHDQDPPVGLRAHVLGAGALILLGVVLFVVACSTATGVREHIADRYAAAGTERVEGARTDSLVYTSSERPSRTAGEISGAVTPADRRVAPAGVFLRYDEDFVTVVPRAGGGSTIYVDAEDAGYRRGFVYLGGWWGTYSGRGESFRGGGPGGGK